MEVERRKNQVFLRGLAPEVTSDDLLQLFQDIGPLKRASVAQEDGQSKGFAFVKFGLAEDATRAVETLNGKEFKGRKLQMEIAVKKGQNPVKAVAGAVTPVDSGLSTIEQQQLTSTEDVTNKRKLADSDNNNSNVILRKEKKVKKEPILKKSVAALLSSAPTIPSKAVPLKAESQQQQQEKKESSAGNVIRSKQLLLIVFGVPSEINKKLMKKLVMKHSRKSEVTLVKEDHPLYESVVTLAKADEKVFLITSPSQPHATKVMTGINNSTVRSSGLQALFDQEHKSSESGSAGSSKMPNNTLFVRNLAEITEPVLRRRKCRLIVRNLSFQSTEQNMIDKLRKFGPLLEVSIPMVSVVVNKSDRNLKHKKEDDKSKGKPNSNDKSNKRKLEAVEEEEKAEDKTEKLKPRGFGFVTFMCEKDAQKAVSSSAGLKICNREVAIDFCSSKEFYLRAQDGGEADVKDSDLAQDEADDNEVVADTLLDLASGSNKLKKKADKDADDDASDEGSHEDDEDDEEEEDFADENIASDDEEEASDEEEADDDEDNVADVVPKAASKEKPKQVTPDVHEGCTVFLRELAFDATVADIRKALSVFGQTAFAAIIKDPVTNMSRGTAFVKFFKPEIAQECVTAIKEDPHRILINGRNFRADIAVDKTQAARLSQGMKLKQSVDKRNLYLANEGLLIDTGKNKAEMSEEDREKRRRAQQDKRKKLINPLFFVSANRLSIRNLPKIITDNDLKIMCLRALKAGLSKNLVTVSDVEAQLRAQGLPVNALTGVYAKEELVIPEHNNKTVKTAKIMLDLGRLKNGVPQSKSYGFVEFLHHSHALTVLRELNNNSHYVKYMPAFAQQQLTTQSAAAARSSNRLIVEFALENFNKVRQLQKREEHNANQPKSAKTIAKEQKAAAAAAATTAAGAAGAKSVGAPAALVKQTNQQPEQDEDESDDEDGDDIDTDDDDKEASSGQPLTKKQRKEAERIAKKKDKQKQRIKKQKDKEKARNNKKK